MKLKIKTLSDMDYTSKKYRECVGMVIFNQKKQVLAGERLNMKDSWQFPQGGVEKSENYLQAAYRELYEELGIQNAKLIYEHSKILKYDFPKEILKTISWKYKGQIQKWFLFYWNEPTTNCILDIQEQEFAAVQFMNLTEVCQNIIDFKKDVYGQILQEFEPKIENWFV